MGTHKCFTDFRCRTNKTDAECSGVQFRSPQKKMSIKFMTSYWKIGELKNSL